MKRWPYVLLIFCQISLADNNKPQEYCSSAKEFITTKEFLTDRKELGLSEKEIIETAKAVAKGCTGAAERFSKSFSVLMKTESGPRGSLKIATQLAQKSEAYTKAYLEIFKKSYLAEYLDLDYKTAQDMAQSLSVDFKGDPDIASEDFMEIVKFCTGEKFLALSKPRCGLIAGRIVKKTENFGRHMATSFIDLFQFIVSEKGPTPDLLMALDIAEKIIAHGPEAPQNFKTAYRYAINEEGLAYTAKDSLKFASELGEYAKFDPEKHRLPAMTGFEDIQEIED